MAIAHHEHRPDVDQIRLASGLDAIAGIWLFISAFFLSATVGGMWNSLVLGVVVIILALIRATGAYAETWVSWINAVLGIWVLISPWVYGSSANAAATWNNVLTGLAIVILACWSALASGRDERMNRPVM